MANTLTQQAEAAFIARLRDLDGTTVSREAVREQAKLVWSEDGLHVRADDLMAALMERDVLGSIVVGYEWLCSVDLAAAE